MIIYNKRTHFYNSVSKTKTAMKVEYKLTERYVALALRNVAK